jgi:membrane-associated phospholipid phosphatase
MVMVLALGAALRFVTLRESIQAFVLVAVMAILPLAALMVRQVRRGAWANADASNRTERPLLFAVAIVTLVVLLATERASESGSFLTRGVVGVLFMLVLCAVITKWVKVSLHVAFGALATTTLLSLGSPLGWVLLAVMPVLVWSRLALKRHTPTEVAVGVVAGSAFGYAIGNL